MGVFPQIGYKIYATVFTLIGFAIANLGLDAIIKYSIPVLVILYPITIVICYDCDCEQVCTTFQNQVCSLTMGLCYSYCRS